MIHLPMKKSIDLKYCFTYCQFFCLNLVSPIKPFLWAKKHFQFKHLAGAAFHHFQLQHIAYGN